jgi:hypothetical protein
MTGVLDRFRGCSSAVARRRRLSHLAGRFDIMHRHGQRRMTWAQMLSATPA